MTRDRSFAPEVMGMNLVPYMRSLQEKDALFTVGRTLKSLSRRGNRLLAQIGTDYSRHVSEKEYDQVIVNQGTLPLDELYFALKPEASNSGEINHDVLIGGEGALFPNRNPKGTFALYRIGDAISSRNTHAAVYDALRHGVLW